jgi:hypothetical protein
MPLSGERACRQLRLTIDARSPMGSMSLRTGGITYLLWSVYSSSSHCTGSRKRKVQRLGASACLKNKFFMLFRSAQSKNCLQVVVHRLRIDIDRAIGMWP